MADDTDLIPPPPQDYVLRLYIAGVTPRSVRAIENVKAVCDAHLRGRYTLEVIDIHQQTGLASTRQIVAVPALVKEQPLPVRTLIGDMSDIGRVLAGLNLSSDIGPSE